MRSTPEQAELTPEQAAEMVAVRTAAAKAETARRDFERAIRSAHPRLSIRQIAVASGLSRSRVHQILHSTKGTP